MTSLRRQARGCLKIASQLLAALLFAATGIVGAAPTFQAAGTAVNWTGTGNQSVVWPTHQAGDIALLVVESTGGQAATLATPAGFAAVSPNSPQSTGAGTAGTRLTVFWARATSAAMASPAVTIATGDHGYAQIITYRGVYEVGNPWDVNSGGTKGTASTSISVTGVTTTVVDTRIVQIATREFDGVTGTAFSLQTNANLTGITERVDAGTTSGNGGGFAVWDGVMATAAATGNTTVTVTNSVNAFMTIALRPPPTTSRFAIATGNWNATTTWSSVSCAGTSGAPLPVAGDDVTICNGDTVAVNVATANLGSLTVETNGVLNGNNAITVAGATDVSGTINATINTGTKNFNGATTVQSGGLMTLGASTVNFANTLAIAGAVRCTSNTGTKTFNGAITVQNGGTLDFEACTANLNATPTSLTVENGGRVEFTTSATGTKTIDGLVQIDNGGTWDASGANEGVTLQGGLLVNGTFTAGTGTYLFNTNDQTIGGGTAITIPNITVTGVTLTNQGDLTASTTLGGTGTLENGDATNAATLRIGFTGALGITNLNATQCSATIKNTVEYRAAGAQTIKVPTASYCHVVLTTSGAKTAGGALTVNGDLTMSGSATFNGGTSLTHDFSGNWIVDTSAGTPFAFTTASTINFNTPATPAQTSVGGTSVATLAFNNVVINNTSGVAWNENSSFSGAAPGLSVSASATLTPAAAVILSGGGTLTGSGTARVTRTAATADFSSQYTITTKTLTNLTIEYIGAAAQVVSNVAYSRLAINNASGVSLPGADVTVTTLLTLASGVVTTSTNNLIVSTAACPGSVSRTGGWVAGNLRLSVPGGGASPTCTWDIGDASGYRPFSIAFTNVGTAGTITAQVTQAAGEHPSIGSSLFDQAYDVNRYWTITNATTAFASAIATFNWLGADVDSGADQAAFVIGRFNGGWTYLTTTPGTNTASASISAAQISAGSSFAIGEQGLTLFSHWRMDQNLWNGTASEVVDSGTGANHGTASSCAFVGCAVSGSVPPKPTTSSVTPALGSGGVSGTCSYGVFNRANKDFVALPGAYPDLGSAADSFTVTAWIRTTDRTQAGQRIMADDENGTGGWAFSLGDPGAGLLRFFSRNVAPVSLDTSVAINNNTWYLVAATVNGTTKQRTIRVYNTAGTLVTSASDTFTGTFGADAGAPSIGGETNNMGEGNANFGFAGDIDEVRVYRAALTATQIDRFKLETRACASFNHVRIEHDGIGLTCAPETMTVKACFDAGCTQLFNGSVSTTLSPTGWVGGDAVVVTGSLTPQLRKTSTGVIALGAGGTSPAPTTGARCFNGATETCSFEFKDSGFIFASVPTVTACKPSTTFTIQAVRTDLTTQNCAPAFTGNRTVNFSRTYISPASGGNNVTLSSVSPAGSVVLDIPRDLTLNFNASATADLTLTYPDAGQVQLNAAFTGSGAEAGLTMTGNTNFVSVPVGVAVVPSGGACVAGDSSCTAYVKAGASFNHAVRGVCWTSDGDTDLTDNAVTPNFQLAGIALSSNLVAPAGGANATLGATSATIASGGTVNVSQAVSEVGVFTITATPPANGYFGLTVPGSTSPNIGRFTPNHFTYATNTPSFAAGCTAGSFTYVGQVFNFGVGAAPVMTVTARNLAGNTTTNYRGGFFKLTNSTLTGRSYTAATGTLDSGGLPLTTVDPAIVDNSNGTASLTFSSGSGLSFTRSTPLAPFNAEISLAINLIDADGVVHESPVGTPANPARFGQASAGNGIAFTGGKDMRFGRLRIVNAAGSALAPLVVPLRTEYYTGTGFALNTADSCTTLSRANISLGSYAKGLAACETMANKPPLADPITFSGGLGALRMSPPGAGNEGSVTLIPQLGASASGDYCAASPGTVSPATAAARSYLQGAWTGGAYDQDPSARAAFGTFGAQPKSFIFHRETY